MKINTVVPKGHLKRKFRNTIGKEGNQRIKAGCTPEGAKRSKWPLSLRVLFLTFRTQHRVPLISEGLLPSWRQPVPPADRGEKPPEAVWRISILCNPRESAPLASPSPSLSSLVFSHGCLPPVWTNRSPWCSGSACFPVHLPKAELCGEGSL